MQALLPPKQLHVAENPAKSLKSWKQQFEIYKTASGLGSKAKSVQSSTLLPVAGPEAINAFNTFSFEENEDKFNKHFLPQKNVSYERHIFNIRVQTAEKTIEVFIKDPKRKANTCEFGDVQDSLI